MLPRRKNICQRFELLENKIIKIYTWLFSIRLDHSNSNICCNYLKLISGEHVGALSISEPNGTNS